MMEKMIQNRIARALKIVLMVLIAGALCGLIVMTLWNWLMPPLFGLHTIGFWQALGLFLLGKILFGGFRGGWGHGRRWRRGMRERWEQMTPEQREQMREHLEACCGHFQAAAPKTEQP